VIGERHFSFLLRVLNAEFGFDALMFQFFFGELFDLRELGFQVNVRARELAFR
jgi:hypothetical protein